MADYTTLRALLPRVTPGPWATLYTDDDGTRLSAITHADGLVLLHWAPGDGTADDAEFIAQARLAVEGLLAEVDELRERLT